MKKIHVIVFLAFLTVIAAKKEKIPTKCPIPEKEYATHLAHETDCTKFYKCNWGQRVLQDCALMGEHRRLHFNRTVQVCDWPALAGCIECPKNPDGNYPTSKISHEKDNCKLYWECIDGEKHLRKCPEGLCFSRTCQDCVKDRKNGKCNDCTCTTHDRIPHECKDNQYYECIDCDKWVLQYCAKNCRFDRKTKTCRNSRNVECPLSTIFSSPLMINNDLL